MSMPEFRDIFQLEVDRYLARLQRKSRGMSLTSANHEGLTVSTLNSSAVHRADPEMSECPELEQLDDVRCLAMGMMEGILMRVSEHVAKCGAMSPQPSAVYSGAANKDAVDRLEERCQELEVEIFRKRAAESQCRNELLAKFQSEYDSTMHRHEHQLDELRREAVAKPLDMPTHSGSAELLELRAQVEQHIARVRGRLEKTQALLRVCTMKKASIDKVEAQQSRALPPAEALLAGAAATGNHVDEEDRALLNAIQKGEKVCRRLQLHFSGA